MGGITIILVASPWQTQVSYGVFLSMSVCNRIYISTLKKISVRSNRKISCNSNKSLSKFVNLVGFRRYFATKGISDKATNYIRLQKKSFWFDFALWLQQRSSRCSNLIWETDPFWCSINFILDYLSDIFENRLSHRIIIVLKSTISACHELLDGIQTGQSL